jgi:hypothetical protein
LLVQKRSTQEKTTPRLRAFRASMPGKYACGLRGLSTGHPALTPNWPASVPATLRAFLHPPAASEGPPGRATRILRVLFRRARSEATARTKHRSAVASLLLSLLSFSAFHRVRATMARCPTRDPCAAVRDGRQARRVIGRDANRGGLLFRLLFSWPHKRKVTRPPQEGKSPSLHNNKSKAKRRN